jgi:tetratricopeptide (TPR) repeat protein
MRPLRNPNIDSLIKKGEKHLKKGQFEDALRIFDFALQLDGKNEKLLEYKSIALNELDGFDEVYECLEQIAEINPEKKEIACIIAEESRNPKM